MLNTLLAFIGGLFKAIIPLVLARHIGKQDAKLKAAEETLDNVKKTNDAIARARADDSLARKLRDRFGL